MGKMNYELVHKSNKHRHVYEKLFEAITFGNYGPAGKLPSEPRLAKIFDVSRPTVAKALGLLEDEGLIVRRPGAGTFVRKSARARDQKLGVLVPRLAVTPQEFGDFVSLYSMAISQMSRTATANDYVLLMNDLPFGDEDEGIAHAKEICKQLLGHRVKGVFFLPLEVSSEKSPVNAEIAEAFDKAGVAVTLLDRDIYDKPQRSRFDIVGINNEQAAFDLTSYLISIGCRKIDFVGGRVDVSSISDRIHGYRKALRANGIVPEDRRVHHFKIQPFATRVEAAEREAVEELLDELNTEAIVCVNDRTAALVMRYMDEMGLKVPADLRVVGFDDEPFCQYLPVPLTTMRQPPEALGTEAVRTLISRAENPDMPARDILFQAKLVVRQSCGGKGNHLK